MMIDKFDNVQKNIMCIVGALNKYIQEAPEHVTFWEWAKVQLTSDAQSSMYNINNWPEGGCPARLIGAWITHAKRLADLHQWDDRKTSLIVLPAGSLMLTIASSGPIQLRFESVHDHNVPLIDEMYHEYTIKTHVSPPIPNGDLSYIDTYLNSVYPKGPIPKKLLKTICVVKSTHHDETYMIVHDERSKL